MNNFAKRILSYKTFFLFLGIVIGAMGYKYDLPPRPLIRQILKGDAEKYNKHNFKIKSWEEAHLTFSKYKSGVPFFLDRPYSDSIGDKRLEGLYLIKLNRHEKRNIIIKTNSPITIYRLVPRSNFRLRHRYEETDIKVQVAGLSLTHTNVLKKKFEKGKLILSPGGPISSLPILFSQDVNVENIFIEKTKY